MQSLIPLYVVLTAQAKMPTSCMGRYGRVAVIKTDGVNMPKHINPRHNTVKGIVQIWDRLFWGTSNKCAFARAVTAAKALAEDLNRQNDVLFLSGDVR